MPIKTSDGKWLVFELATGRQLERWPVDAKVLLAPPDGSPALYGLEPPEGVEPQVPKAPPQMVGAPVRPAVTMFEGQPGDVVGAPSPPTKRRKAEPKAE